MRAGPGRLRRLLAPPHRPHTVTDRSGSRYRLPWAAGTRQVRVTDPLLAKGGPQGLGKKRHGSERTCEVPIGKTATSPIGAPPERGLRGLTQPVLRATYASRSVPWSAHVAFFRGPVNP
jgi:hypothetical protein